MADLVVVDTDLVIDFLRGKGDGVELVQHLIVDSRLRITAITAFELRVGANFQDQRGHILRLLRSRTLSFDLGCGLLAGEITAHLQAMGLGIGHADSMQAGTCLRYDLPFATRNRKHFERVEKLRLVDLDRP